MPRDVVLDTRSCSSVLVDLYSNAAPSIGLATGFLVADAGDLALVTNYHVLSGRNQQTNAPIDRQARIPDRVLVPLPCALGAPKRDGLTALMWSGDVWLLEDEDGTPLWCTHPVRGRAVDVAVLPLGTNAALSHDEAWAYPIGGGPPLSVQFGSSVAIIGFPDGLPTATLTAIWKGGYVASEPDIDVDLEPYFWLDAAGAPGMSGSPVITRQAGPIKAIGGNAVIGMQGNVDRVVGIYSGRANADTSLGRCWRWDVVAEVVTHALGRYRAADIVPRRGELGIHPRADDVHVPRVANDGRYLSIFAGELARGLADNLATLRAAAALRAALANDSESKRIVLRRSDATALLAALARLPAEARVVAFRNALQAELDTPL